MALTRVATWKDAQKGSAVVIEIDRTEFKIDHADLTVHDTEEKIKSEIERQASLSAKQLPEIFIHNNRDGSIAVAIGAEPKVWPEDEVI